MPSNHPVSPFMYSPTPPRAMDGLREDDDDDITTEPIDHLPLRSAYRDQHATDHQLAWLMLLTALSTLLLTIIPVVASLPQITFWFNGNTLWRLFDPIITLPLNLLIMTKASAIASGGKPRYCGFISERSVGWAFWAIGAGIYVQGHGLHTAAALFKHPIQMFNEDHPELVAQYPILYEMYLNMEDLWEHKIAHYMYAVGGMWMTWAQLFVFRNQVHGPLPKSTTALWILGSIGYGLLLAGVAIEFPVGLIVGLVYTLFLSTVCLCIILVNKRNIPKGGLLTMGRRMVPQFYLGACAIGFVIIIGWIGKYGLQNRKAAGVST
ncbi:hypothetical protein BDF14DRAFT_1808254 [Spinellus fusiger]|nr:hypothetical protein BDF14DRAFT_1808254 [Spinellus fusiger]